LIAPALPIVAAPPAFAATNIICVNRPGDTDCAVRPATITDAITAAAGDGVDSIIRIGSGTYTGGPFTFDGSSSPLTVQGNGNGTGDNATVVSGVVANDATVRNLRISVSGSGGEGLVVTGGSIVQDVIVADAPGAVASTATGVRVQGSTIQNVTVNLFRGPSNTGVRVTGNAVLSRLTVRASGTGVAVDAGALSIENSLLDLGAGQVGLRAGTEQSTGIVAVDARQLTVVGGGAGSHGVWAFADDPGVASSVTLANSIVRGSTRTLSASSTAGSARVDVSYSDFQTTDAGGDVHPGDGNLDVDPAFIDPARDFALRAGSPVVDRGSSLVTSGADRNGDARSVDGDRNGSPVPDMGAYELHDVTPPTTVITGGPSGPTNDNTPVFTFRSGPDVTFECLLDGTVFPHCTSPVTTTPLPDGTHTFSVRATDEVFNVETNPPRRTFTVDTTAPDTAFTKKPHKRFHKSRVTFRFGSNEAGARFQCKPDNLPWRGCHSPYRWSVKVGKHRMLVRAVDAAGNTDPTPARYKYKRLKHRR